MVEINVSIKATSAAEYQETLKTLLGGNETTNQVITTKLITTGDIPTPEQVQEAVSKTVEPEKPTRSRKSSAEKAKTEPEPAPAPVEEETAPEPVPTPQPEASTYTLVEVRAKLQDLAKNNKQAEVKGLLSNFGVAKLTDVPEEKYLSLIHI